MSSLRPRDNRKLAHRVRRGLFGTFVCLAGLAALLPAMDGVAAEDAVPGSRFFDAEDGWFDISSFLDTAYGFVPILAPITEPAVGYGAAGVLVFIDRKPVSEGSAFVRPNIAAVGGVATENGTRGLFAGHLGTWMGGKLRTLVGVADADVNLEFFGLGSDRRFGGAGFGYSIAARGGLAGGSYRLGDTPLWLGLQYGAAKTTVTLDGPDTDLPGFTPADRALQLAALTPSLTLDMRDNFFTPTQGAYVDLSLPLFREAFGSDRDFEKAMLTAMYYRPIGRSLFFALRGGAQASSDGTPFYLRPFVSLRGVQALRYQGEQSADVEAELRWQLHPRFSLVGFGGGGVARGDGDRRDREASVTTAGGGFRYLLARKHGLHMGIDVAFGPDEPIYYVVFGSAWMRP